MTVQPMFRLIITKMWLPEDILYISDETLSQLAGDDGDWPTKRAQASSENTKAASYKWFDRPSNWPWGIYLANAAGINLSKRDGNRYTSLTGIILMKINDGGINGEEFFGIYEPNGTVGGFAGGLTNAWTALKTFEVAVADVPNPDYEGEAFAYSIDSLNFFATDDGENPDASSYNTANHTITYKNGGWHRAGWNWEAEEGINVNAYNQVGLNLMPQLFLTPVMAKVAQPNCNSMLFIWIIQQQPSSITKPTKSARMPLNTSIT
jgi:hypothetical protein